MIGWPPEREPSLSGGSAGRRAPHSCSPFTTPRPCKLCPRSLPRVSLDRVRLQAIVAGFYIQIPVIVRVGCGDRLTPAVQQQIAVYQIVIAAARRGFKVKKARPRRKNIAQTLGSQLEAQIHVLINRVIVLIETARPLELLALQHKACRRNRGNLARAGE